MPTSGESVFRAQPEARTPGPLTREEIDRLVTWTLVRAARRIERMLVSLFAGYDLTPVQFGVLAYLASGAPFTQSELARAVLIRPQSMNAVIHEMIDRGLLERVGPGGRGRPTLIKLSTEGAELLDAVEPVVRWVNEPEQLGLDHRRTVELNEMLLDVLASRLPDDLASRLPDELRIERIPERPRPDTAPRGSAGLAQQRPFGVSRTRPAGTG